jgi:excisionase family DNA binding protein
MSTDLLTPIEVAQLLAVSPVTVRQWAQKGMIQARTTPGGHRRFTREAVIDFARRMAMALPDGFVASTGTRILIVDGEQQFNDAHIALLKQQTADVEAEIARDAFTAGRLVARMKPTLILLDLTMAGIDWIEVCRSLKADALAGSPRVIAVTPQASRELEERIIDAGAALLIKPFSTADLIAACALTRTDSVRA